LNESDETQTNKHKQKHKRRAMQSKAKQAKKEQNKHFALTVTISHHKTFIRTKSGLHQDTSRSFSLFGDFDFYRRVYFGKHFRA
jgi:hypothetical protein